MNSRDTANMIGDEEVERPAPTEGSDERMGVVKPPSSFSWVRGVLDLVRSVALVVVCFFLIRALVVEAFKIPTSSMEGTLLAGDFLLVNKAAYGAEIPGLGISLPAFSQLERGDVIVFRPPHEPDKHYVKRLVGMPGDTLWMKRKSLFINGLLVPEPYATYLDPYGDAVHPGMSWQRRYLGEENPKSRYRPSRDNWGPLVVPPENFFVLGDNRDNSEDSRYWGFVERDAIEGQPWVVYYSSAPERGGGTSVFGDVRWSRIGGLIR